MSDNIFAYTAPGASYPEFLSVNDRDQDGVQVVVRGRAKEGCEGPMAGVMLTKEQAAELGRKLTAFAKREAENDEA